VITARARRTSSETSREQTPRSRPTRACDGGLIIAPPTALAHCIFDADKQRLLEGSYPQYIRPGTTHLLTRYDHLLSLFGVAFFPGTFKDIAKFVTVFTLGH